MSKDNSSSGGGISLLGLVFLVFLVMKLAGIGQVANWSWWWVTSPLWLPLTIFVIGFVIFVIIRSLK